MSSADPNAQGGPPEGIPEGEGGAPPIIDPNRPETSRIPPFVEAPPNDAFFLQLNCIMFGAFLVLLNNLLSFYIPTFFKTKNKLTVVFAMVAAILSAVYVIFNLTYLISSVDSGWDCWPRTYVVGVLHLLINAILYAHMVIRTKTAFIAGAAAHKAFYVWYTVCVLAFVGYGINSILTYGDNLTDTKGMCNYHPSLDVILLCIQFVCQVNTIILFSIPALRIRRIRRRRNTNSPQSIESFENFDPYHPHGSFPELIHVLQTFWKRGSPHYTPPLVKKAALGLVIPGVPTFVFGNILLTAIGLPPHGSVYFIATIELLFVAKTASLLEMDRPSLGPNGIPEDQEPFVSTVERATANGNNESIDLSSRKRYFRRSP